MKDLPNRNWSIVSKETFCSSINSLFFKEEREKLLDNFFFKLCKIVEKFDLLRQIFFVATYGHLNFDWVTRVNCIP